MSLNWVARFLKNNWGVLLLSAILLFIIAVNIKPGFTILGNDNFSPEIDPKLTVERSLFAPGWRTYRVLGIPSDSEQADLFRSSIFLVLKTVFPVWIISQGYLFFTFFIASFSMASLSRLVLKKFYPRQDQLVFFFGGLLYMASMLTSWIYFFPVHLFVAAYAFLPFVLWRLACFFEKQSLKNVFFLLIAALFLSTAALTATMFIVAAGVIAVCSVFFSIYFKGEKKNPHMLRIALIGYLIVFSVQLFWALPFITYVKSNTKALQESVINRDITASTIENEAKHNTALNVFRFYSSWMDTKEDQVHFTFPQRDWYKHGIIPNLISFLPAILVAVGAVWVVRKRQQIFLIPLGMFVVGWFLIKGVNTPFGFVYAFLQDTFPVFAQVFRWQSSKLWPLLAIPLPIFGALGVIWIIGRIKERSRLFAFIFGFLLTMLLLIFVYPYFTGNLIRREVFVKMPKEYTALASYLKKHDSSSRIYLAPEANTLYFRNYSWGFWGSVVLHYILPNPLIEKALVTGSFENEQAFTVIRSAYYSEDPATFARTLLTYNTPLVLSDLYATRGNVGYAYNEVTHRKMVIENPAFEKVWGEGKLALYKIKGNQQEKEASALYKGSDFTRLNMMLAGLKKTSFFGADTGELYPFGLSFDEVQVTPDEVIAKTKYQGDKAEYLLRIDPADFENVPTQVVQNNTSLDFYPLMPRLSVNGNSPEYTLPRRHYNIESAPAFISLNETVVDERPGIGKIKNVGTLFPSVGSNSAVRIWNTEFESLNLRSPMSVFCNNRETVGAVLIQEKKTTKCVSRDIIIDKPSIVEVVVGLETNDTTRAVLCVHSRQKQECLNKNTTAFLSSGKTTSLLIPRVFESQDTLKIFLDVDAKADTKVAITSLLVRVYTSQQEAKLVESTDVVGAQEFVYSLSKNDTLELRVPLYQGVSSWQLVPDTVFVPQSSIVAFDDELPFSGSITNVGGQGLTMTNRESNSSMFPKLEFVDPQGGLGFAAVVGNHESGVPADVSIRDIKEELPLWKTKLEYKKTTASFDLFFVPNEVRSYLLETNATAFGPRESLNTIQNLVFQIIPKSWYKLKLIPSNPLVKQVHILPTKDGKDTNTYKGEVGNVGGIYAVNTALSSNWQLTVDGKKQNKKVVINGWQQGWEVDRAGKGQVVFLPNVLVYLGFIPLIGIVGWLIFHVILSVTKNLRDPSLRSG